jgi:hypothetical protein
MGSERRVCNGKLAGADRSTLPVVGLPEVGEVFSVFLISSRLFHNILGDLLRYRRNTETVSTHKRPLTAL